MSFKADTWISSAYDSAKREHDINLKSFGTLGAIDLLRYDSNNQTTKKMELLELVIKKSRLKEANDYLSEIKQEYSRIYGACVSVDAKLEYRGLFGAGSSFGRAAFEIGLAFDTVLNLPFLPGSSVKGAVRAAYREKHVEKMEEDDGFGNPDHRSEVIFADAYPISCADYKYFLYPDIINPHYADDNMDETEVKPNPIIHLTVSPGSIFRFIIAFRNKEQAPEVLKAFAVACHRGLGARTAIGYGRFTLGK